MLTEHILIFIFLYYVSLMRLPVRISFVNEFNFWFTNLINTSLYTQCRLFFYSYVLLCGFEILKFM